MVIKVQPEINSCAYCGKTKDLIHDSQFTVRWGSKPQDLWFCRPQECRAKYQWQQIQKRV